MSHDGVVVVWKQERGFGYIFTDVLNRRIFFHISQWKSIKGPRAGDGVTFEIGPAPHPGKSDVAVNVRPTGVNAFAAKAVA